MEAIPQLAKLFLEPFANRLSVYGQLFVVVVLNDRTVVLQLLFCGKHNFGEGCLPQIPLQVYYAQ